MITTACGIRILDHDRKKENMRYVWGHRSPRRNAGSQSSKSSLAPPFGASPINEPTFKSDMTVFICSICRRSSVSPLCSMVKVVASWLTSCRSSSIPCASCAICVSTSWFKELGCDKDAASVSTCGLNQNDVECCWHPRSENLGFVGLESWRSRAWPFKTSLGLDPSRLRFGPRPVGPLRDWSTTQQEWNRKPYYSVNHHAWCLP